MRYLNDARAGPSPIIPLLLILILVVLMNGGCFDMFWMIFGGGNAEEEEEGGNNFALIMILTVAFILIAPLLDMFYPRSNFIGGMQRDAANPPCSSSWQSSGNKLENASSYDDEGYGFGLGTVLFVVLFFILFNLLK